MPVLIHIDARPSLAASHAAGAAATSVEVADHRVTDLARLLQAAYAERLEEYKVLLKAALGGNARHGFGAPESGFPEVTIKLDGKDLTLAIDDDLYTSLFDLYVFYGSKGLVAAEEAVRLGGSKKRDLVWPSASAFFRFTRNALALVIRETLIGIEASAAASVFDRLSQVKRRIADALATELRFDVVPASTVWIEIHSDQPVETPAMYQLRDRSLAKALYTTMRAAVNAREDYNGLIEKRRKLEEELRQADVAVANESSPGQRSPSSGGDGASIRRRKAELKAQVIEAGLPGAMTTLHAAQRQVSVNVPFALLVLPGLPAECSSEIIEDALGTALVALGKGVERILAATAPGRSLVQADLSGLRDGKSAVRQRIEPREVEALYGPSLRVEHDLISIAAFHVSENPRYIALLHAETWRELIHNGVIGRDSFEYVVAYHWLAAIDEQAAEAAQRKAALARSLMIASSGLSLLALALPPLTPLSLAADLAMLAFTVHGAAHHLGALDDKLQIDLPALASPGYEALAAAGELAAQSSAFRDNLTLEILQQLAPLPLRQIRLVGEFLKLHFYLDDALTLIRESSGQHG
jgi:hypothetical protein